MNEENNKEKFPKGNLGVRSDACLDMLHLLHTCTPSWRPH